MSQPNYSSGYKRLKKWRYLQRKKLKTEISDDSSDEISSVNAISNLNSISDNKTTADKDLRSLDQSPSLSFHSDLPTQDLKVELNQANLLDLNGVDSTNLNSTLECENEITKDSIINISHQIDQKEKLNLRQRLAIWATKNIKFLPHTVVDELLDILRSEGHLELPKTTETLLKTERTEGAVREMLSKKAGKPGEYIYFGIKRGLEKRIIESHYVEDEIDVIINIDGLPLFNKSHMQLMPVLMQVVHEDYFCSPFIVALYGGKAKPDSVNEYLDDFIEEVNDFIINGITIGNKKYSFKLKAMVSATLARAYIKCTKGHTGFCSCERCDTKGMSIKKNPLNPKSHLRVFPDINCSLRTKTSFKKQKQPEHHLPGEVSPLLRIKKFDPVKNVLLENMHLLCEGGMKLIMEKLTLSSSKVKLDLETRNSLADLLNEISPSVPNEFQRKTFLLDELPNWKATQYRFILLYAGPFIFRHILPRDQYRHFLQLSCACRILFNRDLVLEQVDNADYFLREFVSDMPKFYGKSSQVINIHNLIHLADDARTMKTSLSFYSAFPFENYLGKIKALVRPGVKVVSQVFRRMSEIEAAGSVTMYRYPEISAVQAEDKNPFSKFYSKAQVKNFEIGITYPDNLVQLNDGQFFQVSKITCESGRLNLNDFFMMGSIVSNVGRVFKEPMNSKEIGIYKLLEKSNATAKSLKTISVTEIKTKCISLSLQSKTYIATLLHV